MSLRIMALVWDSPIPPRLRLVALALADMADDDGRCWPSVPTLCRKTLQSERTVQGSLRELVEHAALRREERKGRSTIYHLTPAAFAPPQLLPPTPADSAPPPPQLLPPTPADSAPRIVKEPSLEPSRNRQTTTGAKAAKQNGHTYTPPEWVPLDAWNGWIEARKKKNNAPTDRAKALAVLELDKLRQQGNDPETVLNQSTVRGWAGLFHVKPSSSPNEPPVYDFSKFKD